MSGSLPPSVLNSANYWLPNHFWSWLVLILGIIGLIYAAKMISQEKKQFYQDGKWIKWNDLEFFIPAWWTQNTEILESHYFYRSDTRYDWFFEIQYVDYTTVEDAKTNFLTSQQISLDPEVVITHEKNYLLKNEGTLKNTNHFLRIESTATEKEEDRIYLDACWIEFNNGKILQLISKSSVLNGGIEGPYVEEVIKGMKINE